ncbi:MAG: hypothetical protein HY976_02690 [Candidatus Kerfeldbacteria bacterium]|nr:hypothetical protein [Candidatus Kerfeldbacteria bacterium]
MEEQTTFNKGDRVEEPGTYVCVPCGFKRDYKSGDQFAECMSCLSGTPHGDDEYAEGLEMWEKAQPVEPEKT